MDSAPGSGTQMSGSASSHAHEKVPFSHRSSLIALYPPPLHSPSPLPVSLPHLRFVDFAENNASFIEMLQNWSPKLSVCNPGTKNSPCEAVWNASDTEFIFFYLQQCFFPQSPSPQPFQIILVSAAFTSSNCDPSGSRSVFWRLALSFHQHSVLTSLIIFLCNPLAL